jgi:glutaredoxin-like protein NrdH
MTKRMLERNHVSYEAIDLSSSQEAVEKVRSLGYSSAPVVMAGEDHWSGFRLDKLKSLIALSNAS